MNLLEIFSKSRRTRSGNRNDSRPLSAFQRFRLSAFSPPVPAHHPVAAVYDRRPVSAFQNFSLSAFSSPVLRHPSSVLGGFASPRSPIFDLRSSPRAQRPTNSRHQRLATRHGGFAAFTLIELLVVITIIAILAGLTLAAMTGVQEQSVRNRTRAEIAAIANALEQFRNVHDAYPPSGASNLYTNIAPFFDTQNAQTNAGLLVDPYGRPYEYLSGTNALINRASFDLRSHGKNSADTNDDIGNW